MPDRLLHEGQLFGNYRLVRLVGRGGFADVYLARHVHIRRKAAIKILHTQMDGGTVKRFKREAQIVADLQHPHIISLLDFGVHAEHIPYLVMEYAAAGTLRQRHPRGTVLSPVQALEYMVQVADALDFAHSQSIIHRDVKPENMLLNEQGALLLSDFGIATLTSESGAQMTPSVAGTTTYMAPEQLRGKTRPESDQYALAVVIYEWLCGEPPFHGTYPEIAVQHINVSPPSLHTRNPRISLALEEVVNVALAKDPAQRYPSVTAFVEDFRVALQPARRTQNGATFKRAPTQHNPVPSRRQNVPGAPAQPQRSSKPASQRAPSYSTVQPAQPSHISRRTIVLTAGSLALLGGVGGLAWFARQNTQGTHVGSTVGGASKSVTVRATSKTSVISTQSDLGRLSHKYLTTSFVNSVAWSPNGTYIASGNDDGTVEVWDATSTKLIRTYTQHTARVNSIAWSHDEVLIASASDDTTVQVWQVSNGNLIQKYTGHVYAVHSVAWSPDGTLIASGSEDTTVQIWNPQTGNTISVYKGHSNSVLVVTWSPNGKRIASTAVAEHNVLVWDTTNKNIITHHNHSSTVFSVAWASDGAYIASGGMDNSVHIWDANIGSLSYMYNGHSNVVRTIAWAPDRQSVASGSDDNTIQIWTPFDGKFLYEYQKHSSWIYSLSWSLPDGKFIASGSYDKTVQIWQSM